MSIETPNNPDAPGGAINHHTFSITVSGNLNQETHDKISNAIRLAAMMTVQEVRGTNVASLANNPSCGGCSCGAQE